MANSWNHLYSPTVSTSLLTDTTTLNIFESNVTTINAFGAATTNRIGYAGTAASTLNISTNATASGNTKTINIGTNGAVGSFTDIKLGSAISNGTVTINGTAIFGINGGGYVPTAVSLAGCGIVWNKNGNATGATYFQNYRQGGTGGFYFELYSTSGTSPTLLSTPLAIDGSGNSVFSGSLTSSSPSGGIGYTTGAGGTVIQATSITTAVTINKKSGRIIMYANTWTAGQEVIFTVLNSAVGTNDVVYANTGAYFGARFTAEVTYKDNGTFSLIVKNRDTFTSSSNINLTIDFVVLNGASS